MNRRYSLLQDDDCHWYVVPVDKIEEFVAWVETFVEDERPEGVLEIGGGTSLVTFENPTIR